MIVLKRKLTEKKYFKSAILIIRIGTLRKKKSHKIN